MRILILNKPKPDTCKTQSPDEDRYQTQSQILIPIKPKNWSLFLSNLIPIKPKTGSWYLWNKYPDEDSYQT